MRKQLATLALLLATAVLFTGCYSFTGGNIPDHLKTLYIPSVKDNSGYGNPKFKDDLSVKLVETFRNDGSFQLVERSGDARLTVTISSIREETVAVSQGQLETEKKVIVSCETEYYDAVKKKVIWKKTFSNYGTFLIANAGTARDQAISKAIEQIADDILFGVVSGW